MRFVGTYYFARSFQYDFYSCAARSTYMIVRHFLLDISYDYIKEQIGTDATGTHMAPIVRFFRRHGLRVNNRRMNMADLARALDRGAVVLIGLDGDHCGVAYGMDADYVYLADPSLLKLFGRRIGRWAFRSRWDRWGISVRD